jgi:hypothetical protein
LSTPYETPREVKKKLRDLEPLRARAAARDFVRSGTLDKKYKPAVRRVTAAIIATPIAIILGWELYQRQFLGKEQRTYDEATPPPPKPSK